MLIFSTHITLPVTPPGGGSGVGRGRTGRRGLVGGESVILGSSSSYHPSQPIVVKNNWLYWRVEELEAESRLAAKLSCL